MRCVDVIHELATPTGALERAVLTDHLDHCPTCARWAERNVRLDRLWDATRPPDLSSAAWDRIWANVSETLDQPRVTVPAHSAPTPALVMSRSWRRSAVAVFALAQAAAILAGLGLAWNQAPVPTRPQPRSIPVATTPAPLDLVAAAEVSELVFNLPATGTSVISFDDKTIRHLALNENPNEVDPLFNGFNDLESQAGLQ
ncbi:hypothetical protein V5E97_03830 [Singulisphaera sp. Ch08]|uniref:Zinc-finger domain-containing protein n=1 Tax=Singulisphaera sp. Ch08 TaxID=3120278 RepID=A0AAU7CKJ6_9BACT